MKLPISVCMIVGNEELLITNALRSVKDHVSEILVAVGNDSIDQSANIAKKFDAKLSFFDWCDDFSVARNFVLDQATCPWVLMLDADERLLPKGLSAIREAIQRPLDGFGLVIEQCRLDDTFLATSASNVRLFRRQPGLRYYNRAHEEVRLNGERDTGRWALLPNGPHIRHFGYDPSRPKDKRVLRLLEMQLAELPNDQVTLYRLARHHYAAGRQSEAKNWATRALLTSKTELLPGELNWLQYIQRF